MSTKEKSARGQFCDLIRQKLNGTISLEEYEERVAQLAVSLGLMAPWELPDLKNRYKPRPRRAAKGQMLLGFGQRKIGNARTKAAFYRDMPTQV